MKILSAISIMSFLSISSPVIAQEKEINFQENYQDSDNVTAQELSKLEKISLAEAQTKLKKQGEASRIAYASGQDFNNTVAAVDVSPVTGNPIIYVKRTKKTDFSIDSLLTVARKLGGYNQINIRESDVKIVPVAFSAAEIDAESDKVLAQMRSIGLKGSVSADPRTGTMQLNVENILLGKSAVAEGKIQSFLQITVEFSPLINRTGVIWFGGNYYNSSAGNGCTTGFPARYYDPIYRQLLKGFLIAGHCGTSPAYVDLWPTGTWRTPNPNAAKVSSEAQSSSQDFQFVRFADQKNNEIANRFWDGSTRGGTIMRGGFYPTANAFVCKWGRVTGRTCGYVAYNTFRDDRGTFYKLTNPNNSGSNPMAKPGDSGGPVFSGNMVAGIVYGNDPYGAMYFSPLFTLRRTFPNLQIFCDC